MPVWKHGKKDVEVTEREVLKTMDALRAACFKCGKDIHSDDCPIAKAMAAVNELKGS